MPAAFIMFTPSWSSSAMGDFGGTVSSISRRPNWKWGLVVTIPLRFRCPILPTRSPLRLTMHAHKELKAGLAGLFMRLDLRFRHGNKKLSLNPFDKKTKVFAKPTEIVSDEFV